jgi:tetratricopeptide (TPR) repeat protein
MQRIFFFIGLAVLISCTNKRAEEAKTLNDTGVDLMDREEYTEAAGFFHLALQKGNLPNDLEAGILRNLCLLYNFRNQLDSAKFYAKKGFEAADKDGYFYFLNKGEYDLLNKDIQAAKSNYEKAKQIKPDEMAIYNSLGMIYSGSYGDEFANYEKALENNFQAYTLSPREPLAEALATSYMNLDNYKESIALWKKLIEMNPAKMEYHFQLGVALLFSGQEEEGEKKMEYAADRDENCRKMLDEMLVN